MFTAIFVNFFIFWYILKPESKFLFLFGFDNFGTKVKTFPFLSGYLSDFYRIIFVISSRILLGFF